MSVTVEDLRNAFRERYSIFISSGEFDKADVDRLMSDSALCRCFLSANGSLDACLLAIESCFKWRRQDQLNQLSVDSFPVESVGRGSVYFHSSDKLGRPILYFRIEHCGKTTPNELLLARQYIGWLLDSRHKRSPDKQVAVLFDMTNAGLSNLNYDLVRFIIKAFQVYYPMYLANLYVYEMPWVLTAAWKIIRSWLDKRAQEGIIFIQKSTAHQFIPKRRLWRHMGGDDTFEFKFESAQSLTGDCEEDGEGEDANSDDFVDAQAFEEDESEGSRNKDGDKDKDKDALDSNQLSNSNSFVQQPSLDIRRRHPPQQRRQQQQQQQQQVTATSSTHLTLSPSDRIVIDESTCRGRLTITNCRQGDRVAFKVKTTSPSEYKVKPSSGVLDYSGVVVVDVACRNVARLAGGAAGRSDKFQILSAIVGQHSDKEAAMLELKQAPAQAVCERRLSCCLARSAGTAGVSSDVGGVVGGDGAAGDEIQALRCEVDRLTARVDRLVNRQLLIQRLLILVFVSVSLVVIGVWSAGCLTVSPSAENRSTIGRVDTGGD